MFAFVVAVDIFVLFVSGVVLVIGGTVQDGTSVVNNSVDVSSGGGKDGSGIVVASVAAVFLLVLYLFDSSNNQIKNTNGKQL